MEEKKAENKSRGCLLPLTVLLVIVVACLFWARYNFYASYFTPTVLSPPEKQSLEVKLDRLKGPEALKGEDLSGGLEPYSEEGADRSLRFSEKELNSLIASDEEMAKRVYLKLSDDLMTLRFIVPVEDDVPLLGGRTIRLKAGLTVVYRSGLAMVALKGVSLGGIPLPDAWLGNLKNKNLVTEFGEEDGFWKLFAEGVEDMEVGDGYVRILLKE